MSQLMMTNRMHLSRYLTVFLFLFLNFLQEEEDPKGKAKAGSNKRGKKATSKKPPAGGKASKAAAAAVAEEGTIKADVLVNVKFDDDGQAHLDGAGIPTDLCCCNWLCCSCCCDVFFLFIIAFSFTYESSGDDAT